MGAPPRLSDLISESLDQGLCRAGALLHPSVACHRASAKGAKMLVSKLRKSMVITPLLICLTGAGFGAALDPGDDEAPGYRTACKKCGLNNRCEFDLLSDCMDYDLDGNCDGTVTRPKPCN